MYKPRIKTQTPVFEISNRRGRSPCRRPPRARARGPSWRQQRERRHRQRGRRHRQQERQKLSKQKQIVTFGLRQAWCCGVVGNERIRGEGISLDHIFREIWRCIPFEQPSTISPTLIPLVPLAYMVGQNAGTCKSRLTSHIWDSQGNSAGTFVEKTLR